MNNLKLATLLVTFLSSIYVTAGISIRARFINMSNGLGTNNARVVIQDPQGYIWIGTTNGLVRYDGYNATQVTPSDAPNRRLMQDSRIQDMRLHRERYLLLRLRGGKYSCYDTQRDEFIAFDGNYDEVFHAPQGEQLKGNGVRTTPQGEVWLTDGSTGEVTHLTGQYSEGL